MTTTVVEVGKQKFAVQALFNQIMIIRSSSISLESFEHWFCALSLDFFICIDVN